MVPGAPPGMTRANWRTHPYAPWAFGNVAAFLPVAHVAGAPTDPLPSGRGLPPVTIFDDEGAPLDLPRFLRATHAAGLLVLHRGRIVHEAGRVTPHLCFSVTKSLVGLIAELLIADGRIDPAARAGTAVPALAATSFASATLRSLLDMTDGTAFDEDYANPAAQIHDYSRHFWGDGGGGVLAGLQRLDPAPRRPGFAYRTPVTDVAGLMLEALTGATLPDLLSRLVWQPAGASDAAWVCDTAGRAIASAGMSCTLHDLARVAHWLTSAAPGTSAAAALASIIGGGDRELFAAGGQPTRPGFSYRSGWWIDHGTGAINALGVFRQRLHIVPADDLVIARFGAHLIASNAATDALHARLFAAVRAALA